MTIPPFTFNHQAISQAIVTALAVSAIGYWLVIGACHLYTTIRSQMDADKEEARRQRLDRIFAEKWRTR